MRGHVADRELGLLLDGELSPGRQQDLRRHLDDCQACRERAGRLQSTMARVTALHHDGPDRPASSLGRMRLASALDEAEAATPSWWAGIVPVIGGHTALRAAAVAVMVIAAFAVVLLGRRAAPVPNLAADPAGVLPMASLTPGAVSPLTAAELCSGIRPSRLVTSTTRRDVLRAYGMEDVSIADYELDALITPELGGSTDPANLWPQRYHSPVWNARVKDELERRLPELVCNQSITLAQAQQEIATDWIAAYKRHFSTDAPLPAHRAAAGDDEEELILVSDRAAAVLTNR